MCPSAHHEMSLSAKLPGNYGNVSWQCNACMVRGKRGKKRWFCETCNDDYCQACVPPLQEAIGATGHVHIHESLSFVDSLAAKVSEVTISTSIGDKKGASKQKEIPSSLERDKRKCSKRLVDEKLHDPSTEMLLSSIDLGFQEDSETDMFIEALTACASLYSSAT